MLGVVHLNICTHVISAPSEEPTGVSSEAPQRSNQVCRPCKSSRKKTGSRFPAEQHVNSTDQSGVFGYKLHSHEQSPLPHCRLVGGVETAARRFLQKKLQLPIWLTTCVLYVWRARTQSGTSVSDSQPVHG